MSKRTPDFKTELTYATKHVNHLQTVIETLELRDQGQTAELSFFQRELKYAHARLSRLKRFMGAEEQKAGTEISDEEE